MKTKQYSIGMSILLLLFLIFVLLPLIVLFNAWVTMLLWGAVAIEFGFFTIGYMQALLLTVSISWIAHFFHTPNYFRRTKES